MRPPVAVVLSAAQDGLHAGRLLHCMRSGDCLAVVARPLWLVFLDSLLSVSWQLRYHQVMYRHCSSSKSRVTNECPSCSFAQMGTRPAAHARCHCLTTLASTSAAWCTSLTKPQSPKRWLTPPAHRLLDNYQVISCVKRTCWICQTASLSVHECHRVSV